MTLTDFIREMPKVELHVHLEGAVRPETLLKLSKRHNITLPADDVEGVRRWYAFRDFPHFVEIYLKISECMQTPDDIELVAREFLQEQASQNIRYSEVTYTALTHYVQKGIPFADQLAALNSARDWGRDELDVDMAYIIDIPRNLADEAQSMMTAEWAVDAMNDGVVALGLGGYEVGNPPEDFAAAFDYARANGLTSIPHAGEHEGPASIWGAIDSLGAQRIGHGIQAVQDPKLVKYLAQNAIPLEVCPTSNVCLGEVTSVADHPIQQLIDAGCYVTVNSDDPPMFNTTLTDEYAVTATAFGWDAATVEKIGMNAVDAA
ncbi:MAG: adenosine deaminase, partial [Chloroflexota bacterium]